MKLVYATVEVPVRFEDGEDWRTKLPAGRLFSATVEYDIDPEQCLWADLTCQARAWKNGYCGPHQPDPRSYH